MKQILYMHARTIANWHKVAADYIAKDMGIVTHQWLNTFELTPGISMYFELIRKLSNMFEVVVVRNQYDTTSGIYVVGYKSLVVKFIETFRSILIKVERLTRGVKKNAQNKKLHLAEARSQYKRKCISIYITALDRILRYKLNDRILRKMAEEYISQTQSLKNLKQFRW